MSQQQLQQLLQHFLQKKDFLQRAALQRDKELYLLL